MTKDDEAMAGSHEKDPVKLDAGTVRGLVAAWVIVISMAGVSMGFQVYHALKWGHQPWGAAYPEGIVLLLCSVCLLEVISHWHGASPWVKSGGYVILAGSMYLSASATGAVVRPNAPAHQSLLFGFLLDAAALYAFHYILNEPRKARERIARGIEEREAAARAEASQVATLTRALKEEQAAHQKSVSDLGTDFGRRAQALTAQHEEALRFLNERLDDALSGRDTAQDKLAETLRRAESLERTLASVSAQKARKVPAADGESTQAAAADGDLTTELLAYMALREDPELRKPRKGGDLARKVGVSGATARRYREKFLNPDGSLRELPAESLTGPLSDGSR